MRIVHVEDFVHPDAGYQINLVTRLQAKEGHEVIIIAGELEKIPETMTQFFGKDGIEARDKRYFKETGVRIIRRPLLGFYSGRAIFKPGLMAAVKALQPDVVMAHGISTLTGMRFIRSYERLGFPIVLDCHMLEMASVNPFKDLFHAFFRRFLSPTVLKHRIPLIRLTESDFIQRHLGIPMERTTLLPFGTDTDYFRPDAEGRQAFRAKHDIGENDFLVIYAGKLDASKGGMILAEAIRERFEPAGRPLTFMVVGNVAGEYGKTVETAFSESGNRILRFPTQTYLDLLPFYQAADLSLFPRQCSMSFFEAQATGLPVLFEDNEINHQRAGFGNAFLFQPERSESLRAKIKELHRMSAPDFDRMRNAARAYIVDHFNFVPIAHRYTELMEMAVAQFKGQK